MAQEAVDKVRRAAPTDAGAIARLYVDSWRETYAGILPTGMLVNMSQPRLARQWHLRLSGAWRSRPPHPVTMVGETASGELAGFGECGPSRDRDLGYEGEIYTLYVGPNHLGVGWGRALMHGLFGELTKAGIGAAIIWALGPNPSRHFYAASGGRIVAERSSVYWGRRLMEIGYGWPDLAAWLAQGNQTLSSDKEA